MDTTFLSRKLLDVEDTVRLDNGIKNLTDKVTGITLMLYTYPVVIICHIKEDLTEDEKTSISDFIANYNPV